MPAGNADPHPRLRPRPTRALGWLLAVLALAVAPVPAAVASDSLLSGYGGPGNGEQAVLGSTLVGGGKGSGGGGSGSSPSLRATTPAAPIAAKPAAPAATSTTPARSGSSTGRSRRSGARSKGRRAKSPARTPAPPATAAPRPAAAAAVGAPRVIPYPTRAGRAGGLPLGGRDLLVAGLALAALALLGIGLRRLAAEGPDGAARAGIQVASHRAESSG